MDDGIFSHALDAILSDSSFDGSMVSGLAGYGEFVKFGWKVGQVNSERTEGSAHRLHAEFAYQSLR